MNAEFFIHGVPQGHSFLGEKETEDRPFAETFYSNSASAKKSTNFVIETRRIDGKHYCCYTYLKYGLADSGGRSGSYFGMSLRLDWYCTDLQNLYLLFNFIYTKQIAGSFIVEDNNGTAKYKIESLSEKAAEFRDIQKYIFTRLHDFKGDFVSMAELSASSSSSVVKCHPNDAAKFDAVELITKYGKIEISPEYATLRENELMKQEKQKRAGMESQITTLQNRENKMQQDYERQVQQLKHSMTEMERKTRKSSEDIRNIADIFAREIHPILKNYADMPALPKSDFSDYETKPVGTSQWHTYKKYIFIIGITLLLGLGIFFLFFNNKKEKDPSEIKMEQNGGMLPNNAQQDNFDDKGESKKKTPSDNVEEINREEYSHDDKLKKIENASTIERSQKDNTSRVKEQAKENLDTVNKKNDTELENAPLPETDKNESENDSTSQTQTA